MRKKKKNRWLILCGVVLTLLFIPFLSHSREIIWLEKFLRDGYADVFRFFHLVKAEQIEVNEDLKELRIQELEQNVKELERLLELNTTLIGYQLKNATTISRDVSHYLDSFIINKGQADGIVENQAVIDSFGLLGKTFNVTKHTSEVKLITSSNKGYYLSVKIYTANNDYGYGVLKNYDKEQNSFEIDNVNFSLDVQVGNQVVSSGLNDLFPSGIFIGTVAKVEEDSYGTKKKITVSSTRDFNKIRHVAVVVNKNENEEGAS